MLKTTQRISLLSAVVFTLSAKAQVVIPQENAPQYVIDIIEKAKNESQLENMAFELLDVIGPRLVGSPEYKQASNWLVDTYKNWGIETEVKPYGEWKSWQRGITQLEMTYPRLKSLEGTQLAWNVTTKKPVEAEVITIPTFKDKTDFTNWIKTVKGKIVLVSMYQKYGRPDSQLKEHALPEDYEMIKQEKAAALEEWNVNLKSTGYTTNQLIEALENAGAVGIVSSFWAGELGANRIFSAKTNKIPMVDVALEDYGMLYRLASKGKHPKMKINTQSKDLGKTETFNTIATIRGTEKPNEYVLLSAHLDSWDGSQGATDNGTGTITMLEVARILKEVLPNPKRTIIIGHWDSEEQGLNGSRAFAEDNPEIMKNTIVSFNQDSGTGRIVNLNGQGYTDAYNYLGRWLNNVPSDITKDIKTTFPGTPGTGGTDNAAFIPYGVPAFNLGSQNWGYGGYTWHTNRDSYDKILFNEVKRNVILTAILTYQAVQDDEDITKEKRIMPLDKDGKTQEWPQPKSPNRTGDYK